jgi:hypothetical protein
MLLRLFSRSTAQAEGGSSWGVVDCSGSDTTRRHLLMSAFPGLNEED